MTLNGPVPIGQADAPRIAEFLGSQEWPFHGGGAAEEVAAGYFAADVRAFWVMAGAGAAVPAGLIKLFDLADGTPMFDLRIGAAYRGAGLGSQALRWLTGYLFTELPAIRRIEGTTRQDNVAMRRTFRACGYVKEAHYRQAWPASDGTVYDAVGYAMLRSDWESGTVTLPDWAEDLPSHRRQPTEPRTQKSLPSGSARTRHRTSPWPRSTSVAPRSCSRATSAA